MKNKLNGCCGFFEGQMLNSRRREKNINKSQPAPNQRKLSYTHYLVMELLVMMNQKNQRWSFLAAINIS
jgi:hypothetical protein